MTPGDLPLVLGALAAVAAVGVFLAARLAREPSRFAAVLMVAALGLLVLAESAAPRGARAEEVLPALHRIVARLVG